MEAVFKEKSYPANYPADALAIIDAMSFSKGKSVTILGSMAMRSQQYAGDYDLFEEVKTKGSEHQALRDLADGFKNIVKGLLATKNIFVGDIKAGSIAEWEILNTNAGIINGKVEHYNATESRHRIDELEKAKIISSGEAKYAHTLIKDSMTAEDLIEAKKELKFHIVRWSPQEVLQGSKVLRDKKRYTLEEAFSSHSMTKLDVIGFIENSRFTDFSIIYEFFNKGKALNDFPLNVAQSLNEDIVYYKAHGNHFKVLKRMLALAKLNKDSTAVNELIPILNSDLGRLYLISSDVGTLIELFENERKVPMDLVRFQLDQMKARMGNIYNLPDFLSEEHDLIGDINAVLKMSNKAQLLSRLHQIKAKMEGILNTNAKAKGGRRVKGGATRAERALASEMRAKYFLEISRTPSGAIIRPEVFKLLSAIIHDQDPRPIAGDPLTNTNPSLSVITDEPAPKTPRTPAMKQRVRELANFIMREEKLPGFPINRAEWQGVEPATPDMLPANLYSLKFPSFIEDESVGVWENFIKTGLASADDMALLPKDPAGAPLPFPSYQGATPADFRSYFGADYDRFGTTNTPFVPPQPPQSFPEQLGNLAPLPPADPTTANAIEAVRATTAGLSQQEREALAQMDETNAYALLLREQMGESSQRLSRVEQLPLREEANQREIEELRREIERETPIVEAQEREAERRAYEASEAGRAEAQTRAEAEARAQAEAEEARRAEAQARAQAVEEARLEALKPRGTVTAEDQAEIERLMAEAEKVAEANPALKMTESIIEGAFTKEAMAKLPEDVREKAKVALKEFQKAQGGIRTLAQDAKFKADKSRLEAELKTFPKGLDKVKKPNEKQKEQLKRLGEIQDELDLIPEDNKARKKELADAEKYRDRYETAVLELKAIFKEHFALKPKPKVISEEEIKAILEGKPARTLGVEGLSDSPEYDDKETRETVEQIKLPNGAGVVTEIAEVTSVNAFIDSGIHNTIRSTVILNKQLAEGRITREAYDREIGIMPDKLVEDTQKVELSSLLSALAQSVILRHSEIFKDCVLDGVDGRISDASKVGDPNYKQFSILRKGLKIAFDKLNFFPNFIESLRPVSDKNLLTMNLMAVEISDVVNKSMIKSITDNKVFLKQVEQIATIMLGDAPHMDSHFWQQPDSPKIKRWLPNVRGLLAGYTPFERNLVFTAVALRLNEGKQLELTFPPQWMAGNIVFPEGLGTKGYKGEGRVRGRRLRGGNLPVKYQQLKNKLKKAYDFGERTEMGVHYHNYKEVQMDADDPYNEKRIDAYLLGLIKENPFATYKDQIKSKAMEIRGSVPHSEEVIEQGWIDKIERLAVEDIERKNRIYDEYLDSETKKWKAPPMGLTAEIASGNFPRRRPKSPEVPRPSAPTEEGRRGRQPSQAPPEGRTMGVEKGEASGEGRVRGGWIPADSVLRCLSNEDIEQHAHNDAEYEFMVNRRNELRKKRKPRGNACADTSIRRKKPPPPPPPTGMLVGTAKPKSFAKAMKELMAKQ
jgi:hypothetical protein